MTLTDLLTLVSAVIAAASALVVIKRIRARRFAASCRLDELKQAIRSAIDEWKYPDGKDQYLTQPQYRQWENRYTKLIDEIVEISRLLEMTSLGGEARELIALRDEKNDKIIARNDIWVKGQCDKHASLFAKDSGYPLNADQINAILYDEHRSLVVAGAGTGKTSTIVAKARWILAQRLSDPARVRILAFNKKAADEVKERLGRGTHGDSISSTFHSLGLDVVARARGKKPRLTTLDEDKRLMQAFIRRCIDDGLKTPEVANHVIEFLAYFRYPEPDPVPVEKSHEANRWAEGHDIRSLTGVLLRSNSEAIIANWLTLNSIEWVYEQNYELDTATIRYSQYRPDFYLPEYRIYIEHWTCNRNGQLPSSWAQE